MRFNTYPLEIFYSPWRRPREPREQWFRLGRVSHCYLKLSKVSEIFVNESLKDLPTSAINTLTSDCPPNSRRNTSFTEGRTYPAHLSCDCSFGGMGFKQAGKQMRNAEHAACRLGTTRNDRSERRNMKVGSTRENIK